MKIGFIVINLSVKFLSSLWASPFVNTKNVYKKAQEFGIAFVVPIALKANVGDSQISCVLEVTVTGRNLREPLTC